jgi:hypothetical protein
MRDLQLLVLTALSSEGRQKLIDFLESELNETDVAETDPILAVSIETTLQALGAEGYDFS